MTVIRRGMPMGGDKSSKKTTQQPTTTTMFQGRGMGCFGGRESAASIPLPCRVITSRCTRFVCLFVRLSVCLFVCLFGWFLCCLSAPCCRAPNPLVLHHLVAASLLRLISRPHLIIVKSLRHRVLSRLFPPLSLHDVDVNTLPCCSSSTAWWIDCMARCLLGDVYGWICFGLVTVNECVNFLWWRATDQF
jgi:hypothetical protein